MTLASIFLTAYGLGVVVGLFAAIVREGVK